MATAGWHFSEDLIFISRIAGTAEALGLSLQTVRDPGRLPEEDPGCVLVDLQFPGLDIVLLVRSIRTRRSACTIVGYGSHVATDVLKAAREAGCDLVLPRSKFVEDLPRDLPRWFGVPHAAP